MNMILLTIPTLASVATSDLPASEVASVDVLEDDRRREVGPSWTWNTADPWKSNQWGCPWTEPRDGEDCSYNHRNLECNYQKTCCPGGGFFNRNCVAAKVATCQPLLPHPRWRVEEYGKLAWHGSTCYLELVHPRFPPPPPSPRFGRRLGETGLTEDETQELGKDLEGLTMAAIEDENEDIFSTESDRRLEDGPAETADEPELELEEAEQRRTIGPSWTWPPEEWRNYPTLQCPQQRPRHFARCQEFQEGIACQYDRLCCWSGPNRGKCVAKFHATCERMLPNPLFRLERYGRLDYSKGYCDIERVAPPRPPTPRPVPSPVFGRRLDEDETDTEELSLEVEESDDRRREIGPSWTWPPEEWRNYPTLQCPQRRPRRFERCQQFQEGIACQYDRLCCWSGPNRGKCVAEFHATCEMMLPNPLFRVERYGRLEYSKGYCDIARVAPPRPPTPQPVPSPVFGRRLDEDDTEPEELTLEVEDEEEQDRRRELPPPWTQVEEWSPAPVLQCPGNEIYPPRDGLQCEAFQEGLTCQYQMLCCMSGPNRGKCVAGYHATCQFMLPSPLWSVGQYGRLDYSSGYCDIASAQTPPPTPRPVPNPVFGRRLDDDNERDEEPEIRSRETSFRRYGPSADIGVEAAEPQFPAALDLYSDPEETRSGVGQIPDPKYWHVDQWTNNGRDCPEYEPRHGNRCSRNHVGLSCNYERACCPDHKRCVAKRVATCNMMLPEPLWQVESYGKCYYKRGGKCFLGHA